MYCGEKHRYFNIVIANGGSIGVIGQSNAPVTIHNGGKQLTKEELEIIRIYNKLGFRERVRLLRAIAEFDSIAE